MWRAVVGNRMMNRPEFTLAVKELIEAFGKLVVVIGDEYTRRQAAPAASEPESVSPNPDEPLLSKKHLAQRLGVSARTVDTWMATGRVPYLKIGRSVRFSLGDVARHLKEKYRIGARGVR